MKGLLGYPNAIFVLQHKWNWLEKDSNRQFPLKVSQASEAARHTALIVLLGIDLKTCKEKRLGAVKSIKTVSVGCASVDIPF
jgi:hypothetical protein